MKKAVTSQATAIPGSCLQTFIKNTCAKTPAFSARLFLSHEDLRRRARLEREGIHVQLPRTFRIETSYRVFGSGRMQAQRLLQPLHHLRRTNRAPAQKASPDRQSRERFHNRRSPISAQDGCMRTQNCVPRPSRILPSRILHSMKEAEPQAP